MEKKRITAVKSRISSVTKGRFVKQEGFNPNYVVSDGERLSRVRVLATVVDKYLSETGKFAAITIDDGTDTIRAKVFNSLMLDSVNVGDIVDVIGRVKEYNGEVYIAPEIITKSDANHEMLRELEIRIREKHLRKIREIVLQHKNQVSDMAELARVMKERFGLDEDSLDAILSVPEKKEEVDVKKKVLELIEKLDSGQGCDYSDLLESSQLPEEEIDTVVNELLSDGVCFEPKPGKIKKL